MIQESAAAASLQTTKRACDVQQTNGSEYGQRTTCNHNMGSELHSDPLRTLVTATAGEDEEQLKINHLRESGYSQVTELVQHIPGLKMTN